MKRICSVASLVVTCSMVSSLSAAEDPQRLVGQVVLPKRECKLTLVEPTVDVKELEPTSEHLPLYVNGVDGDRFQVASADGGAEYTVAIDQVMDMAAATKYYTARIKADPTDGWAYEMRAMCSEDGENPLDPDVLKRILLDYDGAIKYGRGSPVVYADRASTRYMLGDLAGALADLDQAVKLAPDDPEYLLLRATVYTDESQPQKALADLEAALKLDSEFPDALNDLALLLATSLDDSVRDGKRAVKLALEACELTDWMQYTLVDTLAAAYAEAGDFEKAVAMQEKSIEISGYTDGEDFEGMKARVKQYQEKKPYRFDPMQIEPAPAPSNGLPSRDAPPAPPAGSPPAAPPPVAPPAPPPAPPAL